MKRGLFLGHVTREVGLDGLRGVVTVFYECENCKVDGPAVNCGGLLTVSSTSSCRMNYCLVYSGRRIVLKRSGADGAHVLVGYLVGAGVGLFMIDKYVGDNVKCDRGRKCVRSTLVNFSILASGAYVSCDRGGVGV